MVSSPSWTLDLLVSGSFQGSKGHSFDHGFNVFCFNGCIRCRPKRLNLRSGNLSTIASAAYLILEVSTFTLARAGCKLFEPGALDHTSQPARHFSAMHESILQERRLKRGKIQIRERRCSFYPQRSAGMHGDIPRPLEGSENWIHVSALIVKPSTACRIQQ